MIPSTARHAHTPLPGQEPPVQDPDPFEPPAPADDPPVTNPTRHDPGEHPPVHDPATQS